MTDQERDALLQRMDKRLDRIEKDMVTADRLERFMRVTFGEMLSVSRIAAGLAELRRHAPEEHPVSEATG
ncbi:MAG: hypothetical protein OXJ90_29165 [Spirochaetaceae bacterium]|nr:hypothetical protein [Spirochaetaceae bacterium]